MPAAMHRMQSTSVAVMAPQPLRHSPVPTSSSGRTLGPWRMRGPRAARRAASVSAAAAETSTAVETWQASDDEVVIEFKDVHKAFGNKRVLNGATFQIKRGEAVGIIGGSGTGKSTTLRLIAGLLEPTSGEIIIKGKIRTGLAEDDGQIVDDLGIGLVFQNAALFDSLTVGQNVGFILYEHSDLSQAEIDANVSKCLRQVGLSGVENLMPSQLSGGMRKRVALARAIVERGDTGVQEQLIMYDEPTAGLDPVASTVVEDLMREMHDPPNASGVRKGSNVTTYIVVTHQHSTIRRSVDRLIFLHEGRVVWQGTVEEFDTTEEPIVKQFASGSLDGPMVYK